MANNDWDELEILLEPFKAAQQETEGENYVTMLLVPYAVHMAQTLFEQNYAALREKETVPDILELLQEMKEDFEEC